MSRETTFTWCLWLRKDSNRNWQQQGCRHQHQLQNQGYLLITRFHRLQQHRTVRGNTWDYIYESCHCYGSLGKCSSQLAFPFELGLLHDNQCKKNWMHANICRPDRLSTCLPHWVCKSAITAILLRSPNRKSICDYSLLYKNFFSLASCVFSRLYRSHFKLKTLNKDQ